MKFYSLILSLFIFSKLAIAQENDIWSGNYIIQSPDAGIIDSIKINKTNDANIDEVTNKYKSDLKRWVISSKSDSYKDKLEVKRFLFDLENGYNMYEGFGWTDLHEAGKIECLDANHFFICKTQPNTKVEFGNDETYHTKTGIFGIMLHYGIFELETYE